MIRTWHWDRRGATLEPAGASRTPAHRLAAPLVHELARHGRANAPGTDQEPGRYPLALVTLCAAALCGVVNLLLASDPHANADSYSFEAIARSLLAGTGLVYREPMFPDLPLYAFRSPAYSAFLAITFALGGVGATVALQGALHGVSAALTGAIAGRSAGTRGAWLAFAMYLVWPAAWFHAGQLMSETFFTFVSILTVWLVIRAQSHGRLRWAAIAGVAATIAMLTRPAGLGCAVGVGIWLLLCHPRAAAMFALCALLAWAPWPIRNAARLHAFVPLLTSGGVAAWNIHSNQEPIVAWTWMAQHAELGELGLDRHFREGTQRLVLQDPTAFVRRSLRSALEYLGPLRVRERSVWLHRFALLAALPALLWAGWRRRLLLPALVWGTQGLILIPVAMHERYRFPSEWCVVVAAAIGLQAMTVRWGWRRTAGIAAAGLLLCIVFTAMVARG